MASTPPFYEARVLSLRVSYDDSIDYLESVVFDISSVFTYTTGTVLMVMDGSLVWRAFFNEKLKSQNEKLSNPPKADT